jgi:hypothetical protein
MQIRVIELRFLLRKEAMKGKHILTTMVGMGIALTISSYGHIAEKKDWGKEVDTFPERRVHRWIETERVIDRTTSLSSRRAALLDMYDRNDNGRLDVAERRMIDRDKSVLVTTTKEPIRERTIVRERVIRDDRG